MRKIINQFKSVKNIEYIIFSIIIILGFFVRLYKIGNPVADWHSWRQADTASVTKVYLEKGIDFLYPKYHDISSIQTGHFNPQGYRFVEFPIFNVIHSFLAKSFPKISLEVWGRLVSIFSSLISAYVIFLLGKRFISVWGGILAAAFYAFLPYNIYFTRVILPEPLAVTLALLGLWNFVKYTDQEKPVLLFFSSIFFSISILVKPYTFFYAIPVFFLAAKKWGMKNILRNKKLIISALIVMVPFFLWRVWMRQFPEGIPFWKWTFNGDNIRFKPSFWRWIFGERLTKLILGYWGLIPFVFGLLNYKKGKYFIHYLLLGMFLYVSVIASANVRHDYYQTIIIPSIALTLANGVLSMWEEKERKLVMRGILIFSMLIMFFASASEIKEFYKVNHPEIIKAGQAIQRIAPKDSLVIAPYNGDTAFLYQTGRWGWPHKDRVIEELIENGADYYVSVNYDDETREIMSEFQVIEENDDYVIVDLSDAKNANNSNDTNTYK